MDLKLVLEKHRKWLRGEKGGERANLRRADLSDADLRDVDLSYADLCGAALCYADLRGANLLCANLWGVDLSYADLCGADLRYADLCNADLRDALIDEVAWNTYTSFYPLQCPETGVFVGYKKASSKIVMLEICADAKRSSATTRQCRCSKAKVLSIINPDGTECNLTEVASNYDKNFVYRVGEIVEVPDFDENRWNECAEGIHFFITREEAVKYL